MNRAARIASLMPRSMYPEDRWSFEVAAEGGPERWLLIERGTGDYAGRVWASTHASKRAAKLYNAEQEYAEDWEIDRIVDLDAPAARRP